MVLWDKIKAEKNMEKRAAHIAHCLYHEDCSNGFLDSISPWRYPVALPALTRAL